MTSSNFPISQVIVEINVKIAMKPASPTVDIADIRRKCHETVVEKTSKK